MELNGKTLEVRWLGRVGYEEGLRLQEALVEEKAARRGMADRLLLLEHEPVFTIGRTPDQSSLGELARLPFPVVQTNRGGKATYHGPGQLVGYPVFDLRDRGQDLHRHLRFLEESLVEGCRRLGVAAEVREGLTGVWVGERKLASIGVGVRRWISMHGFALNVCGGLEGFASITPCGLVGVEMTSLEREGVREATVEGVAALMGEVFTQRM
ncbi:MAG: Octanoyltransferase [Verrucomicrobiota bacterium]